MPKDLESNEHPVEETSTSKLDLYSIEVLQQRLDIDYSNEKIVLNELDDKEVERIRNFFKDIDAGVVNSERSNTRREVLLKIGVLLSIGTAGGLLFYVNQLNNRVEDSRKKRYSDYLAQEKKREETKKKEKRELDARIQKLPQMKLVPGALYTKPKMPDGIEEVLFKSITEKLALMVKKNIGNYAAQNVNETDTIQIFKFEQKLIAEFLNILKGVDKKFIKFIEGLFTEIGDSNSFWLRYLNEYLVFQGLYIEISQEEVSKNKYKKGISLNQITDTFHAYADGKSCSDVFYLKTLINSGYKDTLVQGIHQPYGFNGIIVYADNIEKNLRKKTKTDSGKSFSDAYATALTRTTYHEFIHAYISNKYSFLDEYKKEEKLVCEGNISKYSEEFLKKIHKFCLPSEKKFRNIPFRITSLHEICTHGATLVNFNDENDLLDLSSWQKGAPLQYGHAFVIVNKILNKDARKHGLLKKDHHFLRDGLWSYIIRQNVRDADFLRRIGISMYEKGITLIEENKETILEATERMRKFRKENFNDVK